MAKRKKKSATANAAAKALRDAQKEFAAIERAARKDSAAALKEAKQKLQAIKKGVQAARKRIADSIGTHSRNLKKKVSRKK